MAISVEAITKALNELDYSSVTSTSKSKSSSKASTKKKSATMQLLFAPREVRNPTRARASSTLTSMSAAKKARPVQSKGRCA